MVFTGETPDGGVRRGTEGEVLGCCPVRILRQDKGPWCSRVRLRTEVFDEAQSLFVMYYPRS